MRATAALLYKQAIARDEALQEFGADYSKFLAASQIVLELSEYSDEFFDRVNELVQRTNQLNFSAASTNHTKSRPC